MTTNANEKAEALENFEAVALPHIDDLFRTAVCLLGCRSHAEDAVQECFLQAWKSFHRFQRGANLRVWLHKILLEVVSRQRSKWRQWFSRDQPQMPAETEIPEQSTDEDVLAAIRKMPQQYAEVVLLADVHEFTYAEIQEMLGIPIDTLRSRLSKGRDYLRGQLFAVPLQSQYCASS